MNRQNKKFLVATASIVAITLLLSGCGRRGALQPPPSSQVVVTDEQGNTIKKTAPKPDRPFILDGLI